MAEGIANIAKIPELRKRIFFTIAMLAIYRIGIFVPTPGISAEAVRKIVSQGTVFEIFNLFLVEHWLSFLSLLWVLCPTSVHQLYCNC